jgi:hypothetical protein
MPLTQRHTPLTQTHARSHKRHKPLTQRPDPGTARAEDWELDGTCKPQPISGSRSTLPPHFLLLGKDNNDATG